MNRQRMWPLGIAASAVLFLGITVSTAGLIAHGVQARHAEPAPLPAAQFAYDSVPPAQHGDVAPSAGVAASPVSRDAFAGPNRVFVKSLGINAAISEVGARDGNLDMPADVTVIARWSGGAGVHDADGTVLLAGHVNSTEQGRGALYRLFEVQPGAVVVVNDADGRHTLWRVSAIRIAHKAANDTAALFTAVGPRQLVLVTCGGPMVRVDGPDGAYNVYRDNIIVTALPV